MNTGHKIQDQDVILGNEVLLQNSIDAECSELLPFPEH